MSKITETNQQYYQGSQGFRGDAGNTAGQSFTTTFDTNLVFTDATSWDPTTENYALNNFKLYTSPTGFPGSWSEYILAYTVADNIITITAAPGISIYIVVQLKILDGGKYANTDAEAAFGQAVEDNYGGYQYLKLGDVIDNYMVGYVGDGKLIQTAKKSDVVFWAKRSLQEFSYDTLKSIKSQELSIPESLSLVIPQDYVNYVDLSWIDHMGIKHRIYPVNALTTDPYSTPLQDDTGIPTQDNFGGDLEGTSLTEEKWKDADVKLINGQWNTWDSWYDYVAQDYSLNGPWNWGRLYGLDTQYANRNGWFGINEREGKFTFSSNLVNKLIVLEYISDGLAYDLDTKVPKMAEDAMYKSISYNILATRAGIPEGIVMRYKRDRYAALRNAKIRLSNIKLGEFVQVMRGKSKWIKH